MCLPIESGDWFSESLNWIKEIPGYTVGSTNYFDIATFQGLHNSPYMNPRTGMANSGRRFSISKPRHSFLDYFFPVILNQELSTLLLQILK